MMLELALVVFASSVAVFFSNEISAALKKAGAVPGVKLLFPLFVASWLIEKFQDWGYWLLIMFQAISYRLIQHLSSIIPFQVGSMHFARITYLFLLACLPAWVFWIIAKRKGLDQPRPLSYKLGVVLWVLAAVLLSISEAP
jgi:hypothetical protein